MRLSTIRAQVLGMSAIFGTALIIAISGIRRSGPLKRSRTDTGQVSLRSIGRQVPNRELGHRFGPARLPLRSGDGSGRTLRIQARIPKNSLCGLRPPMPCTPKSIERMQQLRKQVLEH